jgi:hypothetical protein
MQQTICVGDSAVSNLHVEWCAGDKKDALANPALLAAAGLVSGCISIYKNWNT